METWLAYILACALVAGIAAVLAKQTLKREHAMEYAATLALLNAIVAVPFWGLADLSTVTPTALVAIGVIGLVSAPAFLFLAKAIRHLPISESSPLLVAEPLIVLVLAILFLGESVSAVQLAGILILLAGAYVLESRRRARLLDPIRVLNNRYAGYILLSLLLYAISSTLDKVVVSNLGVDRFAFIAIVHIILAVVLLAYLAIFYDGIAGVRHGLATAGWPLLLIAVLTVGYRFLGISAVQLEQVSIVLPLKRLSALFAVIVGGELFGEKHLVRKTLACLIMLAGAWLVVAG